MFSLTHPNFFLLFQEENIQRCSISADSRVENSGTEDSTDDENIDVKENGYHDAENEVDQETDDDADRVHSGKLSESSGYAGSDLYDYKVISCNLLFAPSCHLRLMFFAQTKSIQYIFNVYSLLIYKSPFYYEDLRRTRVYI